MSTTQFLCLGVLWVVGLFIVLTYTPLAPLILVDVDSGPVAKTIAATYLIVLTVSVILGACGVFG